MASYQDNKRGIISLTDLIDATPGINVTGNNSGRNDRSFQQISLRGFTPGASHKWARQLFAASLVYLPLLFSALAVDALI